MGSSCARRPVEFKINKLTAFFPRSTRRKGEFTNLLGPFSVIGDLELKKRDSAERVLLLEGSRGCSLPGTGRYVVVYPKGLVAGNFITFERNGRDVFIRAQFSPPRTDLLDFSYTDTKQGLKQVTTSVVYKRLGEAWVAVEIDGKPVGEDV